MSLTNEQKLDLLCQYINPQTDFVKASNGLILLSVEASRKIAQELNLKIAENGQFKPNDICNYIIKKEEQRLAAQESMRRLKDKEEEKKEKLRAKIYLVIETVLELQKTHTGDELYYSVAVRLLELYHNGVLDFNTIYMGLDAATSSDILPNDHKIKEFIAFQQQMDSIFIKVSYMREKAKDEETLIDDITTALLSYIKDDPTITRYIYQVMSNVGFNEDTVSKIKASLYKKYGPVFKEKYKKADFNDESVIKEIYDNYIADNMDINTILGFITEIDRRIDTDEVRYQFFCLSGKNAQIIEIIRSKELSTDEQVDRIVDLMLNEDIPLSTIRKTFNNMKYVGYHHPYSELIKKIKAKLETINEDTEEEIEELVPIQTSTAVLSDDGDNFVEEDANSRRLKIVSKEKELKEEEKKTTLAALLVGAGFIPVAVLSVVLKADPIEIARNSANALSNLATSSASIAEVLPNVATLTILFSSMGTSFVGFINYLKNRFKVSKTKREINELENLEDIFENEKTK